MKILKHLDRLHVIDFIKSQELGTKIYIGGDSEKHKSNADGLWYAEYAVVVVVHYAGCNGAKVFGEITRERDFDQKKDKPRNRLMTEVIKIAQLYLDLQEAFEDYEVEIHLDINKDKKHGSSCVIEEAIGYIRGMCNVVPLVKPTGFAASHVADNFLKHREAYSN